MEKQFFTSQEAAKLTGCTLRQLQYWREKEVIVPTIPGTGTGRSVYYAYSELVELMIMEYLLSIGLSFNTASVVLEDLRAINYDYTHPETTEKLMLCYQLDSTRLHIKGFDSLRATVLISQGLPVIPLWLEQFHQHLNEKLAQLSNQHHQITQWVKEKLEAAGWNSQSHRYLEQYRITKEKGQSKITGKRSRTTQIVDYVLFYQGEIPIAVIEEKSHSRRLNQGLKQAIKYAKALGVQFAYATNGQAIVEYDLITNQQSQERESFPTPKQLWHRLGNNQESNRVK